MSYQFNLVIAHWLNCVLSAVKPFVIYEPWESAVHWTVCISAVGGISQDPPFRSKPTGSLRWLVKPPRESSFLRKTVVARKRRVLQP